MRDSREKETGMQDQDPLPDPPLCLSIKSSNTNSFTRSTTTTQSTVRKKMATGTFTYNALCTKTVKECITQRKIVSHSNLTRAMLLVQELICSQKKIEKILLTKMPPHAKLSFFTYVITGERSANRPKQLWNDAFRVKTSQSAKNQLDPAKNENPPKNRHTPFLHEGL